jgi:predicted dehydrogenase
MKTAGNSKLNVALVGCGCVADYGHAPAIARSDHLRCVAFVDRVRSRAEAFAAKFGGGDVYEDYRAVLRRGDVDIVAVLTLPSAHARIAIDALEAGKHVFTEKPISADSAGARQMIDAARRTGRKLFVGFLLRHTGVFQKMADVVQSGVIGRPVVYRMTGFERYGLDNAFAWNRALDFIRDTSNAFDCGSHYVDLMRWCSGAEAIQVYGTGARLHPDVPVGMFDWEKFDIAFDDGSHGFYETGWGFGFPGARFTKEAIGPLGYVGVHLDVIEEGQEAGAKLVFCPRGGPEEVIARSPMKGFDNEWAYFVRILREDLDPFPALADALASVRIVEAGHRSALEGTPIRLKTG